MQRNRKCCRAKVYSHIRAINYLHYARDRLFAHNHTQNRVACVPKKKKIRELQSNVVERDTESNIAKQAKLRKRQRASEVNKTSLAQNLHKNALKTN